MNFRTIDIEKDKDLLIKFRKDTHYISFGTLEGFDEKSYIDRMIERVNKFPKGQLIIEDKGKPVGQIGLLIEEYNGIDIGYVNLYYLTPEYRNKGLGKELIRYTEEFFRRFNVYEYHLRVSPKNEKAIKFYRRSGMIKLKEEKGKYRMRKYIQDKKGTVHS